jgi:hypothetical protein
MSLIRNRYPGYCQHCNSRVVENAGWCIKEGGRWLCYCEAHVPGQKPEYVRALDKQGRCITPYEPNHLDLFRAFPGASFRQANHSENMLGKPYWQVSLAESDRHRVLEIANKLGLEVAPELRAVRTSSRAEAGKAKGLFPFQVYGVDWLSKSNGESRLLGDDMGLGKTIQVLMALEEHSLAVVPACVKYNWAAEARKWRPDLKVFVVKEKRQWRLPAKGELIICNYEQLPDWLKPVKTHKKAKSWEVEVHVPTQGMRETAQKMTFVIDEAQYAQNWKTERAQKVKGLAMISHNVWGLTGTPLTNRPQQLYGVLESLGMAHKVFGGWTRFVDVMNGSKGRWGGWNWGTPKPIVPELLRRVMLRRTQEQVLPDLPKLFYQTITCELPDDLRADCDDLWDRYGDYFVENIGNERTRDNPLPPFEEFSSIRRRLAESRIPVILELAAQHEEDDIPLIVFSTHIAPLKALAERDGWECIIGSTPPERRTELVKQFQDGKLKGLACSIKAAGVGLTLTRSYKAIFVDLDWVPGNNAQAERRIARIGQTALKCIIVRLVSDHVLDQHVLDLIAWKIDIIVAAIEREIETKPPVQATTKGETEAEYKARMASLQDEVTVEWKWGGIPSDPDIPF